MYIPSDVPQYPIPTVGARIFHDLKMQYKILHNKFLTDENLILESPCNFEKRFETTAILWALGTLSKSHPFIADE